MTFRLLRTALLWLALMSPALASQATLVTPGAPLSMTALASFLSSAFLSVGSCNSGNSAPANGTGNAAFPGECWINTTSNPWVFSYTADGTYWSEFGTLNTSTYVWTPYATGYSVSLGGNFGTAGAFTQAGAFPLTLTATGTTNATFPVGTHTLGAIDLSQTFSATQTFSGTLNVTGTFQVNGNAITFPGVAATLAYLAGNQTFSGTNNFTGPFQIGGTPESFPASGNLVGTSDAQTLTNKTINGASNTLTVRLGSDVTGQTPIANGGTGQSSAVAARQASGLNVYGDAGTPHGDVSVTLGNTERFSYTNAALTASRTWTLPAANVTGQAYTIKIADLAGGVTGTNSLVISRAGSDTINGGGTSVTITTASGGYECSSDGSSKWSCLAMGSASGGGVTSVTCGTGLSGGTITTSGRCDVSGAPVLLNTLTASSSATLSDTTSFTSTYSAYEIWLEDILPSTSGVTCQFQLYVGGTLQTGASYAYAVGGTNAAGAATTSGNGAANSIFCSDGANVSNVSPGMTGVVRIANPSVSAIHILEGHVARATAQLGIAGYWNVAGVITGFQFSFSAGTIASGKIKVYGIP